MIIGAIEGDADQQTCLTRFADEGIDAGRLSFRTRTETPVYLSSTITSTSALTFLHRGATTINALWMGVPTVTIAGNSPLSRGSASWLGQLGLHQYIANDADDFVQRALALSKDLDALKQLRATLRERCMHATSIQPANVASSLSLRYARCGNAGARARRPIASKSNRFRTRLHPPQPASTRSARHMDQRP
jgi:predicted O-linked N-acetylglucosamine transferase (SPINDLY family)